MRIYLVGSTSITKARAFNAVGYPYRLTGYYWLTPSLFKALSAGQESKATKQEDNNGDVKGQV